MFGNRAEDSSSVSPCRSMMRHRHSVTRSVEKARRFTEWFLRRGARPGHRRSLDDQEPARRQGTDDRPRGVELRTADAELRGARMRVMVVVEALAAGEPGQQPPVGGGVLEVPAAAPVAEGVDQGRDHEDVGARVQEPGGQTGPQTDERAQQAQPDPEAQEAVGEEQPIEPIGPEVGSERLQRFHVARFAHVIRDVEELDAPEAEQPGAVRIALTVGEGVVLAMDRDPLLPALARGQPQHDAEADVRTGCTRSDRCASARCR